ncbi:MAG: metal dependent phosphohydrolase [Clostridia bacterium]|jgi:putative nucleotidyltransferase with HDIG domain|nr:metal dependent phosphohydrolase [Clostridia bacterium]
MQEVEAAKVIIPLSKCMPGMILLQPIIDIDTGNTIIGKDQVLTEDMLRRIERFKHTEIWVRIPREETLWQVEKEVIEAYERYVAILKDIIGNKRIGEPIKMDEIEGLAKCITEECTYNFNLLACVNLVKDMDKDVYMHSINVTFLSLLIARWIDYTPTKFKQVAMAALLHDVGKIEMLPYLRNRQEDFTIKEKLEFKRHTIYGYEKLCKYEGLDNEVLKGVLTHHERCDGTGYPLNLSEDRINDIARIIGLADEYDQLRQSKNIFEIVKILKCDMIRKFDINMLLEFCNNVINYYIGEKVMLSTGEIAEVVFIQPHALHRPIVKTEDRYIDLYENVKIEIIKVL